MSIREKERDEETNTHARTQQQYTHTEREREGGRGSIHPPRGGEDTSLPISSCCCAYVCLCGGGSGVLAHSLSHPEISLDDKQTIWYG